LLPPDTTALLPFSFRLFRAGFSVSFSPLIAGFRRFADGVISPDFRLAMPERLRCPPVSILRFRQALVADAMPPPFFFCCFFIISLMLLLIFASYDYFRRFHIFADFAAGCFLYFRCPFFHGLIDSYFDYFDTPSFRHWYFAFSV